MVRQYCAEPAIYNLAYRHYDVNNIVCPPPSKYQAKSDLCFGVLVTEILRAGVRDLPLTVFTEFSQGDGCRLWRAEEKTSGGIDITSLVKHLEFLMSLAFDISAIISSLIGLDPLVNFHRTEYITLPVLYNVSINRFLSDILFRFVISIRVGAPFSAISDQLLCL